MPTLPQNRTFQAVALILFGAAAYLGFAATGMRFYTSLGPGPGFLPAFLALALGLLSAILMVQATWRPADLPADPFGDTNGRAFRAIVAVGGALLLMAALMEPLGFPIVAPPFVFAMLWIFGVRRIGVALVMALLLGLGSYLAFRILLRVQLPDGIWPF